MKKGLVIFDMDETLVESDFTWAIAGERFLDRLGLAHDEHICDAFYERGVSFVISILQNDYGIDKSESELFESLTQETLYDYKYNVSLKSLAQETVSLVRDSNFFTCVLSANSPRVLEIVKNRFSTTLQMDGWFSTRLLPYAKDNPKVYDLVSGYFGIKPSNCILFDDAIYSIKTALSMKMPCFWICDKKHTPNEQHEIPHYSSFLEAMPKIKEVLCK